MTNGSVNASARCGLRLVCAGGFKAAMEKLAPRFEAASGVACTVTVGTPADTRHLMGGGTPFDVAVVTNHTLTDAVEASIDPSTRFSVARSPAGIGVRECLDVQAVDSEATLRAAITTVGSIALSDPKAGTAMATHILAAAGRIGLRDALEAKVRYVHGPGFVVARRVADGEADAVMTLATEILSAPGIRFLGTLPASMGLGTAFDGAIARAAANPSAARAFLDYLRSREAIGLMQSTGLIDP